MTEDDFDLTDDEDDVLSEPEVSEEKPSPKKKKKKDPVEQARIKIRNGDQILRGIGDHNASMYHYWLAYGKYREEEGWEESDIMRLLNLKEGEELGEEFIQTKANALRDAEESKTGKKKPQRDNDCLYLEDYHKKGFLQLYRDTFEALGYSHPYWDILSNSTRWLKKTKDGDTACQLDRDYKVLILKDEFYSICRKNVQHNAPLSIPKTDLKETIDTIAHMDTRYSFGDFILGRLKDYLKSNKLPSPKEAHDQIKNLAWDIGFAPTAIGAEGLKKYFLTWFYRTLCAHARCHYRRAKNHCAEVPEFHEPVVKIRLFLWGGKDFRKSSFGRYSLPKEFQHCYNNGIRIDADERSRKEAASKNTIIIEYAEGFGSKKGDGNKVKSQTDKAKDSTTTRKFQIEPDTQYLLGVEYATSNSLEKTIPYDQSGVAAERFLPVEAKEPIDTKLLRENILPTFASCLSILNSYCKGHGSFFKDGDFTDAMLWDSVSCGDRVSLFELVNHEIGRLPEKVEEDLQPIWSVMSSNPYGGFTEALELYIKDIQSTVGSENTRGLKEFYNKVNSFGVIHVPSLAMEPKPTGQKIQDIAKRFKEIKVFKRGPHWHFNILPAPKPPGESS